MIRPKLSINLEEMFGKYDILIYYQSLILYFIFNQEFEKILLQYDKNEDGELSAEEMAKYFQDAMVCISVLEIEL